MQVMRTVTLAPFWFTVRVSPSPTEMTVAAVRLGAGVVAGVVGDGGGATWLAGCVASQATRPRVRRVAVRRVGMRGIASGTKLYGF